MFTWVLFIVLQNQIGGVATTAISFQSLEMCQKAIPAIMEQYGSQNTKAVCVQVSN